MTTNTEFRDYVLDQLRDMGAFETKNMFGGTAVLQDGNAFAKIKHGFLWLKVDDDNISDFIGAKMPQYTYGKDNSRRLNFYQTPAAVLEDPEILVRWATKASKAAAQSKK